MVQLDDVEVISSQSYPATSTTPAHHSVIVGCSPRKVKTTGSALLGQFQKAGIDPKMRIAEFHVTEDAVVQPGKPRLDQARMFLGVGRRRSGGLTLGFRCA